MRIIKRTLLAMSLFCSTCGSWSSTLANDQVSDWNDFCHYILIAKPGLAAGAARSLTANDIAAASILEAIESDQSEMRIEKKIEGIFVRAYHMPAIKADALKLYKKIKAARYAKSRDPKRIARNILALNGELRQVRNATLRLVNAGQYATPQLLATLEDDTQRDSQAPAIKAMVRIGRPLVYPLAVSLEHLNPATQAQVLSILGQVGYPRALPYIKALIEDVRTAKGVRETAQKTYNKIVAKNHLKGDSNASDLYLKLAEQYYTKATLHASDIDGIDHNNQQGQLWVYERNVGLIPVGVPGEVFGDILAMRAARQSLKLNSKQDRALTVLLAANKRRENRLNGRVDVSYTLPFSPSYYLLAAGPEQQSQVLARAMADGDTALSIDAIAAIGRTAGRKEFENPQGLLKPLIQALNYADRRVRFDAALAIARFRPNKAFLASNQVIQALSEAVRQDDKKIVLLLCQDPSTSKGLRNALRSGGYHVISHRTLSSATADIKSTAGIDLIVTALPTSETKLVVSQFKHNFRIATSPKLLLGDADANVVFNSLYRNNPLISSAVLPGDAYARLHAAFAVASRSTSGHPIEGAESAKYVLESLKQLRVLILDSSRLFKITDAQPAISSAVHDKRNVIASAAGGVLSLLNNKDAQNELFLAAFDTTRDESLQLLLMGHLIESVNLHGNLLSKHQLGQVLQRVKHSTGQLAHAAARLHGALRLPAANVKALLTK